MEINELNHTFCEVFATYFWFLVSLLIYVTSFTPSNISFWTKFRKIVIKYIFIAGTQWYHTSKFWTSIFFRGCSSLIYAKAIYKRGNVNCSGEAWFVVTFSVTMFLYFNLQNVFWKNQIQKKLQIPPILFTYKLHVTEKRTLWHLSAALMTWLELQLIILLTWICLHFSFLIKGY